MHESLSAVSSIPNKSKSEFDEERIVDYNYLEYM